MFSRIRELCLSRGMPEHYSGGEMLEWIEGNLSDRPRNAVNLESVRLDMHDIIELCEQHGVDRRLRREWLEAGLTAGQVARRILSMHPAGR